MDKDTFSHIKGLIIRGYYEGLREVEGEDYTEDEIDEEDEV